MKHTILRLAALAAASHTVASEIIYSTKVTTISSCGPTFGCGSVTTVSPVTSTTITTVTSCTGDVGCGPVTTVSPVTSTTTTTVTSCIGDIGCGSTSVSTPVAPTSTTSTSTSIVESPPLPSAIFITSQTSIAWPDPSSTSAEWGTRADHKSKTTSSSTNAGWSSWADPQTTTTSFPADAGWGTWSEAQTTTTSSSTDAGWGTWADPQTTATSSTTDAGWGTWVHPQTTAISSTTDGGWGAWADPQITSTFSTSTTSCAFPEWSFVSSTTGVVSAITTFCPGPTHVTQGDWTYTITSATTLTITDCPCTLTWPIFTAGTSTWTEPTLPTSGIDPVWTASVASVWTTTPSETATFETASVWSYDPSMTVAPSDAWSATAVAPIATFTGNAHQLTSGLPLALAVAILGLALML